MPKITLTEKAKNDELLRRVIRMGMARQGMSTVSQLASRVGLGRSTLSAKLVDPDTFRLGELRRIYKTLRMECPIDRDDKLCLQSGNISGDLSPE